MKDPLQSAKASPPAASGPLAMEGPSDLMDIDSDYDFGSDFEDIAEDLPPLNLEDTPNVNPPRYTFSDTLSVPSSSSSALSTSLTPSSPSSSQVQHPLSSGSQQQGKLAKSYSHAVGSSGPYKQKFCVVCKHRPIPEDGKHVYITCGISCLQVLESNTPAGSSSTSNVMKGEMSNPQSSSGTVISQISNFLSNPPEPRPTRQIQMCEVCHQRPKHQRGGKIYPTCGLTCAAKFRAPGPVEMCDFCKKRPKVVINGKMYQQCGKTCRDNAKLALSEAINSATCASCVVCWKATKMGDASDFCSVVCQVAAESRAPYLIELPRGHVAFKKVADAYLDAWKQNNTHAPRRIKRIYMVKMKPSSLEDYEQYRTRINSRHSFRKKGNDTRAWLGLTRDCGFGDPGNMEPCSSSSCLLCCIVRGTVAPDKFPEGILTTLSLPRATDTASANNKMRSSNVVVLSKVVLGKAAERSDFLPPLPPAGADSIHLVAWTRTGTKMDYQEYTVFDGHAVQPQYLISFE